MKRILAMMGVAAMLLMSLTACGTPEGPASSKEAKTSSASVSSEAKRVDIALELAEYTSYTAWGHPTVTVYKDLPYGDRRDLPTEGANYPGAGKNTRGATMNGHRSGQDFDLFVPEGVKADSPVLVWLHGGSFCEPYDKDGNENDDLMTAADKGYVVVNMDYILQTDLLAHPDWQTRKEATFDAMLRDVDTLVTYLKTFLPTLGIHPKKIAIGGGSAGGYLSTAYAYDQSCPEQMGLNLKHDIPIGFLLDVAGPCDWSAANASTELIAAANQVMPGVIPMMATVLGKEPTDIVGAMLALPKYSPLSMINKKTVPSILVYDQAPESDDALLKACGIPSDGLIPVSTYTNLCAALEKAGVPYSGTLEINAWHCKVDLAWMAQQLQDFSKYLA